MRASTDDFIFILEWTIPLNSTTSTTKLGNSATKEPDKIRFTNTKNEGSKTGLSYGFAINNLKHKRRVLRNEALSVMRKRVVMKLQQSSM